MVRLACLFILVLGLAGCTGQAETGAAARFNDVASSPPLLRAFLYRMPKGGDLHNHLSGAAYAEGMIRIAANRGLCVDIASAKVSEPPCKPGSQPVADFSHDADAIHRVVDAWSMRDFVPSSGMSGHDQFFATFGRFRGASTTTDMAEEVVARAGRQGMRYIELMTTFQGSDLGKLTKAVHQKTPWKGDMAAFQAALIAGGLTDLVQRAVADADALDRALQQRFRCRTTDALAGCRVTVRWLQQVIRTDPPPSVFAQIVFGAMLARATPKVVGLDLVAPEDHPVALADYKLHMHMLDHVHRAWPQTNISLHAGELALGLVPPEELLFHITDAVELGHARRIGHGVAIMYEANPFRLLEQMASRKVAVEVNLTSNAQILRVEGKDHPFPVYRQFGVPVVISTDDEGVERIDRTHELQRAVTTYGLSWSDLVGLERNTLEYAFLPGASLWADARNWRMIPACEAGLPTLPLPAACAVFLQGSEKARLQWSLERDLVEFDKAAGEMRPPNQ
jgi:adenosine deaminase